MFKLADILNIKLLKYRSDSSNSMVLQCNDTGGAVANTTQRRALWCIFQSTADSMGPDQAHWSLSPCSAFVNPVECQQNQILCGSLLTVAAVEKLFFWSVWSWTPTKSFNIYPSTIASPLPVLVAVVGAIPGDGAKLFAVAAQRLGWELILWKINKENKTK